MAWNAKSFAVAKVVGTSRCYRRLVMGVPAPSSKAGSAAKSTMYSAGNAATLALTASANEGRIFCCFTEGHFFVLSTRPLLAVALHQAGRLALRKTRHDP